jgi:hypothetical protein
MSSPDSASLNHQSGPAKKIVEIRGASLIPLQVAVRCPASPCKAPRSNHQKMTIPPAIF